VSAEHESAADAEFSSAIRDLVDQIQQVQSAVDKLSTAVGKLNDYRDNRALQVVQHEVEAVRRETTVQLVTFLRVFERRIRGTGLIVQPGLRAGGAL
jgi:hypothetical protein